MLETHRQERETLLQRAVLLLEQDPNVAAAWLFGSLGRGSSDDMSDIDLFVVMDTPNSAENANSVNATSADMAVHLTHMAELGPPLLILDAPQNAPPHGAYHMTLYEGQFGPHQVDWYWQPRAFACIPQQTRLLFDRVGLPVSDSPPHFDYQPVPERDPYEVCAQRVNFFWVMLLIAAKYAARDPHSLTMGLLQWTVKPLMETRHFADTGSADLGDTSVFEAIPCPTPADKLRLLRDLAAEMEQLMPRVAALGIRVPNAIVLPAHRYLDFIAALIIPT